MATIIFAAHICVVTIWGQWPGFHIGFWVGKGKEDGNRMIVACEITHACHLGTHEFGSSQISSDTIWDKIVVSYLWQNNNNYTHGHTYAAPYSYKLQYIIHMAIGNVLSWEYTQLVLSPDLNRHVYCFQYNTHDTESHPCWSWFWDRNFKGYGLGLKQVQPPRIDTWLW